MANKFAAGIAQDKGKSKGAATDKRDEKKSKVPVKGKKMPSGKMC